MKLTWRWLQEHVATTMTAAEAAERLTMAGFEVEARVNLGRHLAGVRTGLLRQVTPHPQADRLTVCQVQMGQEQLTIVCGARNHRAGDVVAVALPGAQLANGMTIASTAIRGQPSAGMLCSLTELGLADTSDGVLILPADTADDQPLATVLGYEDELFELNITPNRGDCLGVRGVARELAALTHTSLLPLVVHVEEQPRVAQRHPVTITIEEASACYRYAGRVVTGVTVRPSPDWLVRRLEAVGLRSLNNVVDATNYVMLELGQPLHAFDLAQLQLPIVVRQAGDGERLTALNEQDYTLTSAMTVIADSSRPLALAGIMGGADSGVTGSTVDLLLESAWFDPVAIARTGRKLGLISDSRYRFERGTDPDGIRLALDRVTQLILQLAGGEAGPALLVERPLPYPRAAIPFRPERVNRLSGLMLSTEAMMRYLTALGCQGNEQQVTPPSWRHDLRCEEDLVEEVVRLHGYDQVPVVMPEALLMTPILDDLQQLTAANRRLWSGLGYLEAVNYVFISPEEQQRFAPDQPAMALLNPISEEQSLLRTSLVAGLVASALRNLRRGHTTLRLFEVGRVFLPDGQGGIVEQERLAGLLCGPVQPRSWYAPERMADFFDLKGDVVAWMTSLGISSPDVQTGGPEFLHPGRRAVSPLGWMGQIHPQLQQALDLAVPLFLFEFDCHRLTEQLALERSRVHSLSPISPFPAVHRDLAIVVPNSVSAQAVMAALPRQQQPLIRHAELFDLYAGAGIPDGYKSVAIALTMQADDRTLTEEECQPVLRTIIESLQQRLGATLRGP
ncbi:MAG: phenylalanine--tRNA ligase subunit beta [Magnetococcales bacterium]|nr:phenylalanine--tRNA ligase subunit beta [Magnetococcales bacterium]